MLTDLERLDNADLRRATWVFGVLAALCWAPMTLVHPAASHPPIGRAWVLASGLLWGVISLIAFRYFWETYYGYFYPGWVQRLALINLAFYALIAAGLGMTANALPIQPWLALPILCGLEGIVEHVIAVDHLSVLKKVPWLRGLDRRSVLVFSFFEYAFLWGVGAWLSIGFASLGI